MDYDFIYNPPQEINQEQLDLDLAALLPEGVYLGSTAHFNNDLLCTIFTVTTSRELTGEELNAISG